MDEKKYQDGKFDLEIVGNQGGYEDLHVQIVKRSNGEAIPYDEPIFILRARDHLAIDLLEEYVSMCANDGCTDYQMEGTAKAIERFRAFAKQFPERMKQPGITEGK